MSDGNWQHLTHDYSGANRMRLSRGRLNDGAGALCNPVIVGCLIRNPDLSFRCGLVYLSDKGRTSQEASHCAQMILSERLGVPGSNIDVVLVREKVFRSRRDYHNWLSTYTNDVPELEAELFRVPTPEAPRFNPDLRQHFYMIESTWTNPVSLQLQSESRFWGSILDDPDDVHQFACRAAQAKFWNATNFQPSVSMTPLGMMSQAEGERRKEMFYAQQSRFPDHVTARPLN